MESMLLPAGLLVFPCYSVAYCNAVVKDYSTFTMHSTGHTVTHCGES